MGFFFVGGGIFVGLVFWGWGVGGIFVGLVFWGWGWGWALPARGVGLLGREAARGEEVGHGRRRRGAKRAVRVPLGEPAGLAGVQALARVRRDVRAGLGVVVLVSPALRAREVPAHGRAPLALGVGGPRVLGRALVAEEELAGLVHLGEVALAALAAHVQELLALGVVEHARGLQRESPLGGRGGLALGLAQEVGLALGRAHGGGGVTLLVEGQVAPGNAIADEGLEDGGVAHQQGVARAVALAVPGVVGRRVEVRGVAAVKVKGAVRVDGLRQGGHERHLGGGLWGVGALGVGGVLATEHRTASIFLKS